MKFGGVLVQDAPAIMHSAQLVVQAAHKNTRAVVVVSAMAGVAMLHELTPRSRDLIVSFGECCSAPIMSAALRAAGLTSRSLTGGEAGIVTDDTFGSAAPLLDVSRRTVPRARTPSVCRPFRIARSWNWPGLVPRSSIP